MFNKNKLKGKIVEMGFSVRTIAETLKMNETTFYRKMNGISDFTREEIQKISSLLDLSVQEKEQIFLDRSLSKTQVTARKGGN